MGNSVQKESSEEVTNGAIGTTSGVSNVAEESYEELDFDVEYRTVEVIDTHYYYNDLLPVFIAAYSGQSTRSDRQTLDKVRS